MSGEMTYVEYKLHYSVQKIWTWLSVPILLVFAIWYAKSFSGWALGIMMGIVLVSALFIYSGATAHVGLALGKWIFCTLGLGLLVPFLLELFFIELTEGQGRFVFAIVFCIGYWLCAISIVRSMPGLKGHLVDGDDHPFVQAVKEYQNEQKK